MSQDHSWSLVYGRGYWWASLTQEGPTFPPRGTEGDRASPCPEERSIPSRTGLRPPSEPPFPPALLLLQKPKLNMMVVHTPKTVILNLGSPPVWEPMTLS